MTTSTCGASSSRQRAAISARALVAPLRDASPSAAIEADERRHADPAGVEARARRPSATNAPVSSYDSCEKYDGALIAHELGVAHVQRARRLRRAQPLLRGHGVEVELADVDRDRARGLRAVDEHRQPALALQRAAGRAAGRRPEHCDVAISRVRGVTAARIASSSASPHDDARAGREQRAGEAEVLLVGRDHLVLAGEPEAGEHGRAAARRRVDERDLRRRRRRDAPRARAAPPRAARASARSTRLPLRPSREVALAPARRARRPSRARAARSCPRSGTRSARAPGTARVPPRRSSDGEFYRRVIREEPAVDAAPLLGPRAGGVDGRPRTRIWSMLPAAAREKPVAAVVGRPGRAHVRVAGEDRPVAASALRRRPRPASSCASPVDVEVRDDRRRRRRGRLADAPHRRRSLTDERALVARPRSCGATRIALAWPVNAERSRPWSSSVSQPAELGAPEPRPRATAPRPLMPLQRRELRQRPDRHLLQADDVRAVGGDELDHLAQERTALRAARVLPWKRFHVRTTQRHAA